MRSPFPSLLKNLLTTGSSAVLAILLLTACDSSKRDALNALEAKNISPSSAELIKALENGQNEVAHLLIKADVTPSSINRVGQNTAMLALKNNEPWIAQMAIERGDSKDSADLKKRSLLWYTLEHNEPSIAKQLLDKGVSPNQLTANGSSFLAHALTTGRHAIASLLLKAGASPNATNNQGKTILALACEQGLGDMSDTLIRKYNAQEKPTEHLLHIAAQNGDRNLTELLLRKKRNLHQLNSDQLSPLHIALKHQHTDCAKTLLQNGADSNTPTPEGWTPLHLAARNGDTHSINQLLSYGANLHQHNQNQSALDIALASRHLATATYLLHRGSHPRDWLLTATNNRDHELAQLLIAQGVAPGKTSLTSRDTPLAAAVRNGDYQLTNLYLRAGAPRDAKGYDKATPLHLAVAAIDIPMTQLLLDHGADSNLDFSQPTHPDFVERIKSDGVVRWFLRRDSRISPLMMAADSASMELVDTLLKGKADTGAYTRRHRLRPYSFAVRRSDTPMIKLMFGRDPNRDERRVSIDLSKQRLTVFNESDEVIFETNVSTGKKGHRTPRGEFVISNKYRHWESTIYEGAKMPFFQRLSGNDFGFHYGNCPGYPASHGCIRVPYSRAAKLFQITKVGDRVNIVP